MRKKAIRPKIKTLLEVLPQQTDKFLMKWIAVPLFIGLLAGCTNSTPQVGYLQDPNFGKTLPAAPGSYVAGDTAGVKANMTAPGYKATMLVHAGNQSQAAVTTDNSYHLYIRETAE